MACRRLHDREPGSQICLVDHDPRKLTSIGKNPALRTVNAAAVPYLADALASARPPDWIIPAIPRHVAFAWLRLQRPPGEVWRRIPVPSVVGKDLPLVMPGTSGELYLSLSNQLCPDDCPEPAGKCYVTGLPREYSLYDYLANLSPQDYSSVIIRSRQLAPGVGGYRPADLRQSLGQVLEFPGKIIISTACRCHGVSHALEKLAEREAVGDI